MLAEKKRVVAPYVVDSRMTVDKLIDYLTKIKKKGNGKFIVKCQGYTFQRDLCEIKKSSREVIL